MAEWCHARPADDIIGLLWPAGVAVGKVMQPHHQPDLPPLEFRGFFEELAHPVIGTSRYSTLPMKFSNSPDRLHARPAPLLGEHNDELLRELGLSSAEIDTLEADGVIGASLVSEA